MLANEPSVLSPLCLLAERCCELAKQIDLVTLVLKSKQVVITMCQQLVHTNGISWSCLQNLLLLLLLLRRISPS